MRNAKHTNPFGMTDDEYEQELQQQQQIKEFQSRLLTDDELYDLAVYYKHYQLKHNRVQPRAEFMQRNSLTWQHYNQFKSYIKNMDLETWFNIKAN